MKTLLQKYSTFLKAKGLQPRTLEYYEWHIEKFLQYTEAEIQDFGDVKKFREKYYIIIERPSLGNDSRKKHLKCARIFADFLIQEEVIEENAPRQIKPPKVQTKLPIAVEDEDISAIFRAINRRWTGFLHFRNTMIVQTFLYTGLRRNELINLKREHITKNKIFVKSGKGNKDRTIYIPEHFGEMLDDYMRKTYGTGEYLFYTNRSPKISQSGMKKIFTEIKKISGLKILYPHRLRHTYASRMLEQNIDIAVVRDQMGHKNITTTNRYIAVRDKHRAEVMQGLKF